MINNMMTKEDFYDMTNGMRAVIDNALQQLFVNCPEDYVLFLANGEYNELWTNNQSLNLMPYAICGDNEDNRYDSTRQRFLCEFLNTHYIFADKQELQDDEYRINVEFLIYTHIWESKPFLKRLYRLANLLCGKEYEWKNKIPPYKKSDFIEKKIIKPFNTANCLLGRVITDYYKRDLRNAIAHSDYQIDSARRMISFKSDTKPHISYDEWSIIFVYSISLSYYLLDVVKERKMRIIQDFGKNSFTIKMPFSDGTIKHVCIQYDTDKEEFCYMQK